MSAKSGLEQTYKLLTKGGLANILGIAYQSIDRWRLLNEFPCTEYNGKTMYALEIQQATNGLVTIEDLLGFIPHPQQLELYKRKAATNAIEQAEAEHNFHENHG